MDIAEIVGQHGTDAGRTESQRPLSFHQKEISPPVRFLATDLPLFRLRGRRQYTFSHEIDRSSLPRNCCGIWGGKLAWMFRESSGDILLRRAQLGRLERLNAAAGAWYQRMLTEGEAGTQKARLSRKSWHSERYVYPV